MELGKPGENHKLLAEMAGSWTYTMKMMMDPVTGKPSESKGTASKATSTGAILSQRHREFHMPGKTANDRRTQGIAVEVT